VFYVPDADGDKPKRKKRRKSKGGKPRSASIEQSPGVASLGTASIDEESKNELLAMLEQKRIEITKAGSGESERNENVFVEEKADVDQLDDSSDCSQGSVAVKRDGSGGKSEKTDILSSGVVVDADSSDAVLLAERKTKLSKILELEEEKSSEDSKEVLLPKRGVYLVWCQMKRFFQINPLRSQDIKINGNVSLCHYRQVT
jgi:ribosomal protein S8E